MAYKEDYSVFRKVLQLMADDSGMQLRSDIQWQDIETESIMDNMERNLNMLSEEQLETFAMGEDSDVQALVEKEHLTRENEVFNLCFLEPKQNNACFLD